MVWRDFISRRDRTSLACATPTTRKKKKLTPRITLATTKEKKNRSPHTRETTHYDPYLSATACTSPAALRAGPHPTVCAPFNVLGTCKECVLLFTALRQARGQTALSRFPNDVLVCLVELRFFSIICVNVKRRLVLPASRTLRWTHFFATFRVARSTLQTPKLWLVGWCHVSTKKHKKSNKEEVSKGVHPRRLKK